jgi:hypothetical protein
MLAPHFTSAKVKPKWSYTSIPLICRHGVDRETLPLYTAVDMDAHIF